jgi:hypothetical protein
MRVFPEGNFGWFLTKHERRGGGGDKQEKIEMKERCERGKGKFDEELVDNYSAWK